MKSLFSHNAYCPITVLLQECVMENLLLFKLSVWYTNMHTHTTNIYKHYLLIHTYHTHIHTFISHKHTHITHTTHAYTHIHIHIHTHIYHTNIHILYTPHSHLPWPFYLFSYFLLNIVSFFSSSTIHPFAVWAPAWSPACAEGGGQKTTYENCFSLHHVCLGDLTQAARLTASVSAY